MTIKELKEEIAGLPDDMRVFVTRWNLASQRDVEEYATAKVGPAEVYDYTAGKFLEFEALKIY